MPKIRKKTSKRKDTHTREKVKKKVAEAHKKAKKAAKKDITWKSNKKEKDLGIPSKFPFKDQILAEAVEQKLLRDEEKRIRRENQKAAHQAASLGLPDPSIAALAKSANPYASLANEREMDSDVSNSDSEDNSGGASASLRLHAKSLREVINKSDVIIQVLDARDPEGTRSRKIEREAVHVHGKKLVLVLNKIDLVPKDIVEAWLQHLRRSFPTLPFKSSTQSQRKHLSSSSAAEHVTAGASSTSPSPLLTLLKNYSRAGSLTIGVIGIPNVGKSSLINTLKRSKACRVAPTPGFTKEVQIVSLDGSLKILDCPGIVYEGGDQRPETVLQNCLAVEQVEDPMGPVEVILRKCKKEHLMMLYNIPFFAEMKDFLIAVARSRGRLKKGGIPDLFGACRTVLRDWNAGRIPYYTVPPPILTIPSSGPGTDGAKVPSASLLTSTADIGSAAILTELAPEFDLDSLFKEADSGALKDIKTSKDLGPGNLVRLNESVMGMTIEDGERDPYGELRLLGESTFVAHDEDDVPMLATVSPSSKPGRKRFANESEVVSLPPRTKQKQVTFNDGPVSTVSQKAKMFADAPEEAPLQLNKIIKQQAKKDRKKRAKTSRNAMEGVDAQAQTPADVESLDSVKSQPYDFARFFNAPSRANDEDENL